MKDLLVKAVLKIISALILIAGILGLAQLVGPFMNTVGLFVALVALFWPSSAIGQYGYQLWVGFDKFGNAGRGGSHKETISSCLGKSLHYDHDPVFWFKQIDRLIAFFLDTVDKNHCYNSIDWRVGSQKNQPPETW